MKTKTVNVSDELWERIKGCMAVTKIFNASEFLRLALEAAVERVERKYQIVATPEESSMAGEDAPRTDFLANLES